MDEIKTKYLSNKRTLLSVPGTVKSDAYVSENDATVQLVELTANLGRYTSSLSTAQFSGVGQVLIPNNDILGQTYLHLKLPDTAGGVGAANWVAPQGWGWNAIKSISYLWGSSNVSQISVSGKTLWSIALAQCDTAEKRSQFCYLGGSFLPTPTTDGAGLNGDDGEGIGYDCYIPLALPWSVLCHGGKIGFDTSLLNSPITIQVQFAQASDFLTWAADRNAETLVALPSSFSTAEVVIRQQMFSDRGQSLKAEMVNNPQEVYNYPFKHYQSAQFDFKSGADKKTAVNLTNFINADLIGMVLFAVKKSNLQGGAIANTSHTNMTLNPLEISMPSDLKLLFNGQVLFNSPGKLYLLQNCVNLSGSGSYSSVKYASSSIVAGTGKIVVNTTALKPFIRDMVFVDFSRKHSLCFESEYDNTFRIANQVLSLEMVMPDAITEYTLFASYIYNGVNAVQQGASNLYFD